MELAGRTRGPEELVEIPTRDVVQLRIAPLEGEMPPIAEIRVGTRRSFEIAQADRTATPSTLGAREVEIARLLQSGLSRPEVAARRRDPARREGMTPTRAVKLHSIPMLASARCLRGPS